MKDIKREISEILNVEQKNLNEIELEDVEFSPFAQQNIDNVVGKILTINNPKKFIIKQQITKPDRLPCKSFWVENTKDLVLFISIGNESRAIVVPEDGWMIRDNIMIH